MKNSGLTLIEIIFYLAISAVVFLASFSALNSINQAKVKNQIISEVEYQGNFIMNEMLQSIRTSKQANYPIVQNSGTALSLMMSDALIDPTIYNLYNNNITVKKGVSSEVGLGNSKIEVSSVSFSNDSVSPDYDSIKIVLTINYINESGKAEYEYSKSFYGTASTRQKK